MITPKDNEVKLWSYGGGALPEVYDYVVPEDDLESEIFNNSYAFLTEEEAYTSVELVLQDRINSLVNRLSQAVEHRRKIRDARVKSVSERSM